MGNLQIKDVPTELHDEIRRRAGVRGVTIRDYVLQLLQDDVSVMLQEEWLEEMLAREPIDLGGMTSAELVRTGRDEHEAELMQRFGLDPDAGR